MDRRAFIAGLGAVASLPGLPRTVAAAPAPVPPAAPAEGALFRALARSSFHAAAASMRLPWHGPALVRDLLIEAGPEGVTLAYTLDGVRYRAALAPTVRGIGDALRVEARTRPDHGRGLGLDMTLAGPPEVVGEA